MKIEKIWVITVLCRRSEPCLPACTNQQRFLSFSFFSLSLFFFSFLFLFFCSFLFLLVHTNSRICFFRRVDRKVFHIFYEKSHFKSFSGIVWKKLWILDYQLWTKGSFLSGPESNLQKLCSSSTEDCSIRTLLFHFIEFFLENV